MLGNSNTNVTMYDLFTLKHGIFLEIVVSSYVIFYYYYSEKEIAGITFGFVILNCT